MGKAKKGRAKYYSYDVMLEVFVISNCHGNNEEYFVNIRNEVFISMK